MRVLKKVILVLVLGIFSITLFACSDEKDDDKQNEVVNEYTVTFVADGKATDVKVPEGEKASKPADPVKEGYKFLGWYVGDTLYDFEDAVNADVELVAKFVKAGITFKEEEITAHVDDVFKLEFECEDYEILLWDTTDEDVVGVEDGVVTAVGVGTAEVSVSIEGTEYFDVVTIVVTEKVVKVGTYSVTVPKQVLLNDLVSVNVVDGEGNEVTDYTLTSKNEEVLLISNNKMFGYKEGKCEVEITVGESKVTEEILVAPVKATVTTIDVEGNKGVFVGAQVTLTSKVEEKLVYLSSDPEIATVDQYGVVTGVKEGVVYITVALKKDKNIYTKYEINVFESAEVTKLAGGEYFYDEILNYNELPFGVTQYTHWGYTKTDNAGIDEDGIGSSKLIIDTSKYYSQQVNVLELPSQLETKVVVWANTNNHAWTLNSVRAMIQDYEKLNPGYKVVAAVNGDFFDINGNYNFRYSTNGATVGDGEYFKSQSGKTIAFKNDGTATSFVAGIPQKTDVLKLSVYDSEDNIIGTYDIHSVNQEPERGKVSVYFGTYNGDHEYVPQTFATTKKSFVVENAFKTLPHSTTDFYGMGEISSTANSLVLSKGQFAIASDNQIVSQALKVGTKIRVQYEYVGEFEGIQSATGCGDTIIYGGELHSDAIESGNLATRAPRTAIGVREDGTIVMCVIDGRQVKKGMYGLDRNELGSIMKAYGCVDAYNLDGGGSSTMVIRTADGLQVLNSPSDGSERRDANCVLIVAKDPGYETSVTDITTNSATVNVSNSNEEFKDLPMYIKFNGEFKEVVDGKVELTGLNHNTKYGYEVYYKDNDGKMVQTLTMNSFKTSKTGFKFCSVTVKEDGDYYLISINYIDPDKASNADFANITVNGLKTFLSDGKKKFKKSLFTDGIIESIEIEFTYEDNGEEKVYHDQNVDFVMLP